MRLSPLVKATLQAAALSTLSNVLGQIVEDYRKGGSYTLNLIELLRFVLLTLITAPPNYKWQQLLEHTFPGYEVRAQPSLPMTQRDAVGREKKKEEDFGNKSAKPRINVQNTLAKWFIDSITVGALLNTVAFYVVMGVLKGQGTDQIQQNVQTKTIPLIITGYKVWPLVSIISFTFVPVERRIVFISSVGVLWGVYMSIVAAKV